MFSYIIEMSIRNITQPNNNTIYAKEFIGELNGIQGQVITGLNSPGQVLTIVSTDPKVVSFQDVPEGIPDTVGFPDGYVLKIIDNNTNEVNWEPDSVGGAVVPFVLTGDAVNALQVRNTLLEASLTVDTTTSTVQLQGITRVEGVDQPNKFGVYNDADTINPEFSVDTFNHQVKIGGYAEFNNTGETVLIKNTANVNKFKVENSLSQPVFKVDTSDNYVESYADQTFCAGIDQPNKFAVYNSTDPFPTFSVSTDEPNLTIRADGESIIELLPIDNTISVSDTSNSNISTIQLKNQNGLTDRLVITHTNDGSNVSQIQCSTLHVDSKLRVIGTGAKGKLAVKDAVGDDIFAVNTDGDVGTVFIANGLDHANKFTVRNSLAVGVLQVDTLNNQIITAGKLLVYGDSENNKILVNDTAGDNVFRVDTVNKQTIIPTTATLEITDLPTVNTNATNKLYVDNKFSSPRVLDNIMTYVNELAGGGVLPSVVSPTAQVAFSQFVWTGATLITTTPLNFTVVSPGVLQYDGTDTRWFNINIEIGCVSTTADQLIQVVLIDSLDAVIPATLSQFYTSTTDRNGGTSVNITLQLSNLDQVKVAIRTPRAATSLTIENYKLQIIEN